MLSVLEKKTIAQQNFLYLTILNNIKNVDKPTLEIDIFFTVIYNFENLVEFLAAFEYFII